jgi:hypothetical protein
MGVYDRQIATAQRMIAAKGELCTWRKMIAPVGDDPANPAAGTPADYAVRIVFFPNNQLHLLSTLSMLKETDIPGGRFYGLMGAVSFTPELVDTVINSKGKQFSIIDTNGIDELAPNGETILYKLRFSK